MIPAVHGMFRRQQASAACLHEHRTEHMGVASAAVMAKISENERAAQAMAMTIQQIAARRSATSS